MAYTLKTYNQRPGTEKAAAAWDIGVARFGALAEMSADGLGCFFTPLSFGAGVTQASRFSPWWKLNCEIKERQGAKAEADWKDLAAGPSFARGPQPEPRNPNT